MSDSALRVQVSNKDSSICAPSLNFLLLFNLAGEPIVPHPELALPTLPMVVSLLSLHAVMAVFLVYLVHEDSVPPCLHCPASLK